VAAKTTTKLGREWWRNGGREKEKKESYENMREERSRKVILSVIISGSI
jgi:hypothetical protein